MSIGWNFTVFVLIVKVKCPNSLSLIVSPLLLSKRKGLFYAEQSGVFVVSLVEGTAQSFRKKIDSFVIQATLGDSGESA